MWQAYVNSHIMVLNNVRLNKDILQENEYLQEKLTCPHILHRTVWSWEHHPTPHLYKIPVETTKKWTWKRDLRVAYLW